VLSELKGDFQYTYSDKPHKFPQRNQSLVVFSSLPLCYESAQNFQAQQPPCIDHLKKTK